MKISQEVRDYADGKAAIQVGMAQLSYPQILFY